MATKLKDIAIKVGEYAHGNETKSRYKTIGAIMQALNFSSFLAQ